MSTAAQRLVIGQDAQAAVNDLSLLLNNIRDLPKRYSDAGAFTDADLTSLPGSPPAAALTSVITMISQLQNFFGNLAVTQGDYQSTLDGFRSN